MAKAGFAGEVRLKIGFRVCLVAVGRKWVGPE